MPSDIGSLPPEIASRIAGYAATRDQLGRSEASVLLLRRAGAPDLVLKSEAAGPFAELPGEVQRLRWLSSVGLPAPTVIAEAHGGSRYWLLMSAVEGENLACLRAEPSVIVDMAAAALRRLHAVDVVDCPYHRGLDHMLSLARARMHAGLVDETDFDDERQGRSAADLMDELIRRRPSETRTVVVHGDPCLPNLIGNAGIFSGYIDVGRLGVADPYVDIALACNSIAYNLGPQWVSVFLERYGLGVVDEARLDYYRLLDEFF